MMTLKEAGLFILTPGRNPSVPEPWNRPETFVVDALFRSGHGPSALDAPELGRTETRRHHDSPSSKTECTASYRARTDAGDRPERLRTASSTRMRSTCWPRIRPGTCHEGTERTDRAELQRPPVRRRPRGLAGCSESRRPQAP